MPSLSGRTVDLSDSPSSGAIRANEPVVVTDAAKDPRLCSSLSTLDDARIRATVWVPVRQVGKRTDLLCMDAALPHTWSDDEVRTLSAVANQLSNAVS